ncbi:MAG: hypothetical protein LBF12_04520 [Christensenellaceae bacterium]|nr:hypothetical protein [Christensenellaceae bacterium]
MPNKIKQALGIIPAISLLEEDGRFYIEIKVKKYATPISCNGKYYIRSGSITQELTGRELDEFLLRAYEKTWDSLPVPNFQITDLENDALRLFREKAVASLRLSEAEAEVSDKALLTNMKLFDGSELTRAAVLLFHRDPEILTIGGG